MADSCLFLFLLILLFCCFSVTVVSPDFDTKGWNQAQWGYKTEHLCQPLSENLKAALSHLEPNPELHLPLKNEFLPTDFELREKAMDVQYLLCPFIVEHRNRAWWGFFEYGRANLVLVFFSVCYLATF
jgi:secreted Zn-dependent insulinase-like peptidase